MPAGGAYHPLWPGKRPGGRPAVAPVYRVLVHRQYFDRWLEMPERVSVEKAQQLWDHLAHNPGGPPPIGSTCILRGKLGNPQGEGWSRTIHYEVSGAGRVNYQYADAYRASRDGDLHRVVAILTIDYSSH
ncbi:hypothetical protein CCE01nite_19720 [Cellulomonas cellasea]|uniref:Uncharacterized protein n=1 Tax=Cellulomonas cellasea TaxID=43670 RepID=A0A4Y3KVD6_9CELL|nr:hypothetical protein CCE01nite_19720 [Cellulomonas cellasea]